MKWSLNTTNKTLCIYIFLKRPMGSKRNRAYNLKHIFTNW